MKKARTRLYESGITAIALGFMFFMMGCDGEDDPGPGPGTYLVGKVTGGGWVTTPGGGKANFGFNASNCENPAIPVGQFNFHDMSIADGAVKMKGKLLRVGQCDVEGGCTDVESGESCPKGGYVLEVAYRSTNPKLPGAGEAVACVVDNGEGINGEADVVSFVVSTGPFLGYEISGNAKGNIQAHTCDE